MARRRIRNMCRRRIPQGLCDRDDVNAELPSEAHAPGKCGRLICSFYGMRGAAQGREEDYLAIFKGEGMLAGKSAPTVFFNEATGTRCVVHGDDLTFLGYAEDLQRMRSCM